MDIDWCRAKPVKPLSHTVATSRTLYREVETPKYVMDIDWCQTKPVKPLSRALATSRTLYREVETP